MMAEMTPKMMLGTQTEICGGIDPFSANVRNSIKNKMKIKESRNPRAICNPVPPLLFREETITPIKTKIKIVKGEE